MKFLLKILIFALILNSCARKESYDVKTKIYSVDYEKYRNRNELKTIDLDSIENYSVLRFEMGRIACDDKVSGLKIKSKTTEYYVIGFVACPEYDMVNCYFRRNNISIVNDSIINSWSDTDKSIPIENLRLELDTIMSKSYNFQYGKDSLKPALIRLYMEDESSMAETKRVLSEIALQFEKIKSDKGPAYFQYQILFENINFFDFEIRPPPPPPKK